MSDKLKQQEYIKARVSIDEKTSCWKWLRSKDAKGYGWASFKGESFKAYRLSYSCFIGKLVKGLVIDHLCRNPSCVNPAHLEQVTMRINTLRGVGATALNAKKKSCWRGHPFSKENTILVKGGRMCRACAKISDAIYHLKKVERRKNEHQRKRTLETV